MSEEELEVVDVEEESTESLIFRNGGKIPIEHLKGKDYLMGIMVDRNGNPDFFPNYQAEKGKEVEVRYDSRVIDDIIKHTPFSADLFPVKQINKSFVNTVQSIVDIYQNQVEGLENMTYQRIAMEVGIDPKTVRRFLGIGALVDLVQWESYIDTKGETKGRFLQKTPTKKKPRISPQDDQVISEFTEWFYQPEIVKWFNRPANTSARKGWDMKLVPNPDFDKTKPESEKNRKTILSGAKGVAGELFKIMKIMQITPAKFASYRQYDDEALDKVKERIMKDVWKDPRTAKNDPKTKGKFEDIRWNIIDWSKSLEAPDPFYKILKSGKYKGTSRQIQSKKTAHNTWYNYAGIIIQFLESHNIAVPDQEPTSIFAQLANKPYYAHIALTADQILAMKNDIKKGKDGDNPKIKKVTATVVDVDTGEIEVKEIEEELSIDKSYWDDCYLYFLLSLELGYRAEEAFTIIAKEVPEESDNSGIVFFDESGNNVSFEDYNIKDNLEVQIYTRKSERPNVAGQGTRIHAGNIQSPECKELIVKRLKQVLEGETKSEKLAWEKYGIRKEFDGAEYLQHSLIGADGRYTQLGTLNQPSDYYQSASDIAKEGKVETVKGVEENRGKMRDMMRHCYWTAKLRDSYWYMRSLHALRHVFAQYWLILSDYNYGCVAIIGHWKTESIVRQVYGKPKKGMEAMLKRKFSTGENNDKTPFEMMKIKEKKIAGITEQQAKRSESNYVDMQRIKQEDQIARDNIYNNGGMYGGKLYERGTMPKSIVKERDADPKIEVSS